MSENPGHRWLARPWLSRVLRVLIIALPIAASFATAFWISRQIPRGDGLGAAVIWWLAFAIPSALVLFAADRLTRRFLPLAALLQLSLLFPDRAPSRFRVARKAGRVTDLRKHIEEARAAGTRDDSVLAAESLLTLVAALSKHDRATRGHSERVRVFTDLLASELGLSADDRDRLRWGGLLHDIGKLAVPAEILQKQGSPSPEERAVIDQHPIAGLRIAAPVVPWLKGWSGAIGEHHERFDGTGYPAKLAGDEISLGGRIVAVADAYETMTAARPYKKPMSVVAAREELARCAGTHFDPKLVRAFLNISVGHLWRAVGPLSWIAAIPWVPKAAFASRKAARQATNGTAAAAVAMAVAVSSSPVALTPPPPAVVHHAPPPPIEVLGDAIGPDPVDAPPLPPAEPAAARTEAAPAQAARPAAPPATAAAPRPATPPPAVQETPPPRERPHRNHGQCVSEKARSEPSPKKGEVVSETARDDC